MRLSYDCLHHTSGQHHAKDGGDMAQRTVYLYLVEAKGLLYDAVFQTVLHGRLFTVDAEEFASGKGLVALEFVPYGTGQSIALHFAEFCQTYAGRVYPQCRSHTT